MKKKGLKKLSLNKDAIAKLNNAEMSSLRGGYATYITINPPPPPCGAGTVISVIVQVSLAVCLAGDCCGTTVHH